MLLLLLFVFSVCLAIVNGPTVPCVRLTSSVNQVKYGVWLLDVKQWFFVQWGSMPVDKQKCNLESLKFFCVPTLILLKLLWIQAEIFVVHSLLFYLVLYALYFLFSFFLDCILGCNWSYNNWPTFFIPFYLWLY